MKGATGNIKPGLTANKNVDSSDHLSSFDNSFTHQIAPLASQPKP